MNDVLKHYKIKITAESPVFIGSGKQIGKKDYAYLSKTRQAVVIDIQKLYLALKEKNLASEYEKFYLYNKMDLGSWLRAKRFSDQQILSMGKYVLDTADAYIEKFERGQNTVQNILEYIKDGYGVPYVPGSSVKGMLKTALLCYEITRDISKRNEIIRRLEKGISIRNGKERPDRFLKGETLELEALVFNTLKCDEEKFLNAVNSNLSELIVSDSRPLSVSDLTICQKVDVSIDGTERKMPLFRESLKPGTEICCDLSIGGRSPYSIDDILSSIDCMNEIVYQYFYRRFNRGSMDPDTVWLGGGAGFLSKTIVYALYGEKGFEKADTIFKNVLGRKYQEHKHMKDRMLKLAPHTCKCTRYKGQLYDMGMGKIEVIG